MKIVSTNIGSEKSIQWKNETITTGIYKLPVKGTIHLGSHGVKGDHINNLKVHGGLEKACYGYGENYYNYWKELYPNLEWTYGMFGENITITNLDETKIHVGNVYQLGETKVEVTKPREPCFKLGIRFNDMKIIKDFWHSTKSGLYFKILETGNVHKNDELILLEDKPENITIAELYTSKRIKKEL